METLNKYGWLINIIVLVILFTCGPYLFHTPQTNSSTTITVDTMYIPSKAEIHNLVTNNNTKPTTIENHYHTEIMGPIDTGAVLRDYFSKRIYQDTVKNDSIDIILHESVFKSELQRQKVAYRWKVPERIVNKTTTKDAKGFYLGAFFNVNRKYYGAGPAGSYLYKRNNFGAGYDIINQGFQINYSFRLKK